MRGTIHDPLDGQARDVIASKQAKPLEEFERRRLRDLEERRAKRSAEGGKCGGLNERQAAADRKQPPPDEGDFDDFGRRIRKRQVDAAAAVKSTAGLKADRASAALQRLREKGCRRSRSRSAKSNRDA